MDSEARPEVRAEGGSDKPSSGSDNPTPVLSSGRQLPEFIHQLESNSRLRLSEHEERPGLSRMLSTQERAGAQEEEMELVINRYPT